MTTVKQFIYDDDFETTYSTKQIAILCGVTQETVRKWIKTNELAWYNSIGMSSGYVVKKGDLISFLRHKYSKYYNRELTKEEIKDYLLACIYKCNKELTGAETVLRRERNDLTKAYEKLLNEKI